MRMLTYQAEVLHENVLVCKYLSVLHALSHLQLPVIEFHIQSFFKNPNHLILYSHTNIDHDSIFRLDYKHFHLIYI